MSRKRRNDGAPDDDFGFPVDFRRSPIYERRGEPEFPASSPRWIEIASEEEMEEFFIAREEALSNLKNLNQQIERFNAWFDFYMTFKSPTVVENLRETRAEKIKSLTELAKSQLDKLGANENSIEELRRESAKLNKQIAHKKEIKKELLRSLLEENNLTAYVLSEKPEQPSEDVPCYRFPLDTAFIEMKTKFMRVQARKVTSISGISRFAKPEVNRVEWPQETASVNEALANYAMYRERYGIIEEPRREAVDHYQEVRLEFEHKLMSEIEELVPTLAEALLEEQRQNDIYSDLEASIERRFLQLDKQDDVLKKLGREFYNLQKAYEKETKVLDKATKRHVGSPSECLVCFHPFSRGVNSCKCPMMYNCGHSFCRECSDEAKRLAGRLFQCPLCRKVQTTALIPNFAAMPQDPENL